MTLHQAYQKILKSYGNDVNKTMQWFAIPIFEFKHKSANEMIKSGKQRIVIDYVSKNF